jgi:Protein of unknown function (DUF3999)
MMRRARAVLALTLTFGVSALAQQEPRFSVERSAQTQGSGPRRLAVDVTLLSAGSPFRVTHRGEAMVAEGGLNDLRLFDASGRPVPYLLVQRRQEPGWRDGRILPIATTKTTSGFEVDVGVATTIDRVRVTGLPGPFLKRLTLEGSGDRAHWTLLQGEGTLFNLPDEQISNEDLSFQAGLYRYVRVIWNDANSGRVPLPVHVFARETGGLPPITEASADVPFERRPSEPGRSRYRVRLPGARLPIVALALDVAPGHVFRAVSVAESRFAGTEAAPVVLGSGTLVRVLRAGAAAESLRVRISPPAEAELDLTVEDANNAPLDLRRVFAVFAELPWIYFEASSPTVVGRYGDVTATKPTYDLEAARASIDLSRTTEAQWGSARPLAATTAPPGPAPAISAGATLEGAFRYSRPIAAANREGLAALPLDAAVLSHSQGPMSRFSDVRIADGANRQVPYLLERRGEPLSIDLPVAPATASQRPPLPPLGGGSRSVYRLSLPERQLPAGSVSVETSARVFQRSVQIGIVRPADRSRRDAWFDLVSATTWRHTDEQAVAPALALPLGPVDANELWLVIDEGDNAPLPLSRARLLLPSYRLRFFAPQGAGLRLVYGRGDLQPPRYDLSLLAPRLMGAPATEVSAGPESSRPEGAAFISPKWFWIFLGAAVLVLLALIVRLAKRA